MRHTRNTTRRSALWGKAGGGHLLVLMLIVSFALVLPGALAALSTASWCD
jgi:hypothetical protein